MAICASSHRGEIGPPQQEHAGSRDRQRRHDHQRTFVVGGVDQRARGHGGQHADDPAHGEDHADVGRAPPMDLEECRQIGAEAVAHVGHEEIERHQRSDRPGKPEEQCRRCRAAGPNRCGCLHGALLAMTGPALQSGRLSSGCVVSRSRSRCALGAWQVRLCTQAETKAPTILQTPVDVVTPWSQTSPTEKCTPTDRRRYQGG